jgi:hypothetical protein
MENQPKYTQENKINIKTGSIESAEEINQNIQEAIEQAKNNNDYSYLIDTLNKLQYIEDSCDDSKAMNIIHSIQIDLQAMVYQYGIKNNIEKEDIAKILVVMQEYIPKINSSISNYVDKSSQEYKLFKLFGVEKFYEKLGIYLSNKERKIDTNDYISPEEVNFLEIIIILLSLNKNPNTEYIDRLKNLITIYTDKNNEYNSMRVDELTNDDAIITTRGKIRNAAQIILMVLSLAHPADNSNTKTIYLPNNKRPTKEYTFKKTIK